MLHSGDVLIADLGAPSGREAGFPRPVVVITAQRVLDGHPSVVHVVPLTSTIRDRRTEVVLDPDAENGLRRRSTAQCQHVRAIAVGRISEVIGNVGPRALSQLREILADLLDL
jgi:mRNA interferase MazF